MFLKRYLCFPITLNEPIYRFFIKIDKKVISSFEHTEHKMLFNVVKLFCYGDCTDYLQSKAEVGYELNPAEINKLQLLSLISLASQVGYFKVILSM